MPLVGAVAAPHSHLQLFTRPAESEDYKRKVGEGRKALMVLREVVDRSRADSILILHDDHFVNFDFRCYPPFALVTAREAKGSGVIDPAQIEAITGATYRRYAGKTSYESAPKGIPQHMADWEADKPYVYSVDTTLALELLHGLMADGFDIPFTTNGTMDGELVLTQNFLNPAADKSIVLMLTNGYVPPLPYPRRCYALGQAMRRIIDRSPRRVLVCATGGMSHYPGTPLYGKVDEVFDRNLLAMLERGEGARLAELMPDDLLASGNGELVNWVIAAGIAGERKCRTVDYIRLWHIGLGYVYWEM